MNEIFIFNLFVFKIICGGDVEINLGDEIVNNLFFNVGFLINNF